jgi:NDP-4-keto-2,6-dideoxyhexose 3-C-methyltransferase
VPHRIDRCRVCGNPELIEILDLGTQALTGVFPAAGQADPESLPLVLVICRGADGARGGCGLVQLADSADPAAMYGMDYGYRSGLNPSMVRHLEEKVGRIVDRIALVSGDLVIDIGSNDATLLRAYGSRGLDLVGLDPTGLKFRKYYPDHVKLIPEFFSAEKIRDEFGDRRARVVTSISMFYDLEDPTSFMQQVHDVLDDDGLWVLEQSYMPTMLDRNSYDTVCHEHLEYYALGQLRWMADRVGMRILDVEFNDVNGGSFSVTMARRDSSWKVDGRSVRSALEREAERGLHDPETFRDFRRRTERSRDALVAFLIEARRDGKKVFGYGASTKGNVILQYCGITPELLPCIAEINEDKFGARTPGTGIPIVSEDEARARAPDYFLVLPWHFRTGIVERESRFRAAGGRLVFPLPTLEIV